MSEPVKRRKKKWKDYVVTGYLNPEKSSGPRLMLIWHTLCICVDVVVAVAL